MIFRDESGSSPGAISYHHNNDFMEFKVNGNIAATIDDNKNSLINGASSETSSVGAITMKQGTDPTSSSADQISIFATSGANATLGLRTEQAVVAETDETKFSHKLAVKINGSNYYLMLTES